MSDVQYLRVWISRLHTKVGQSSPGNSIVRTFRGIGYMLSTRDHAPTVEGDEATDDDEDAPVALTNEAARTT